MRNENSDVFIFPDVDLDNKCMYPIGQVANRFSVTLRAIRYYCELGLIKEEWKAEERCFDVHNLKRLSLVLQGKFLGFSLQEMSTFIVDRQEPRVGPVLIIPAARLDEVIQGLKLKQEKTLTQLRAISRYTDIQSQVAAA